METETETENGNESAAVNSGYRRLFIIRKDLNLTHGKMAAMVGHCCEAYWTNFLKNVTLIFAHVPI